MVWQKFSLRESVPPLVELLAHVLCSGSTVILELVFRPFFQPPALPSYCQLQPFIPGIWIKVDNQNRQGDALSITYQFGEAPCSEG